MIRAGSGKPPEQSRPVAAPGEETRLSRRFGSIRIAVPLVILAVTAAAGWHRLAAIDLLRVRETLRLVPFGSVLGIQLLALLAILAMASYDVLIASALGIRRSWRAWIHDAWIANTFNNMLGLAGLTGSGLRYLLAGREQLSHRQAASQAALVMFTIPLGLSVLAWPLWLSGAAHGAWLSSGALVVAAAYLPLYVLMTGNSGLHRRLLGTLPAFTGRQQALLVCLSTFDWLLAALTLWLSLTVSGVDVPAVPVMTAFATASLAGIASMLPGGAGVFDGVLLLLLHTAGASGEALVAGIVIFRVVYYLVPWLIGIYLGGAVLTADENAPLGALLQQWRRSPLLAPLRLPLVLFSTIAVRALAYLTFAAGVVLLVSSALPGPLSAVHGGLPASLSQALMAEGVHLSGVFVGVTLLILAGGVVRQVETVYRIVIPVLLSGAVLVLLRDFHYIQAGFLVALAGLLRMQRRRFYRRAFPVLSRRTARWLLAVLASLVLYAAIGHLVYDNVWQTDALHLSTSVTVYAERFLRALMLLPLFALGVEGWLFFRLPRPDSKRPDGAALTAAGEFLEQYGGNYFSHLLLAGDKQLFYAADRRVLIPYASVRNRLVVLGDPVGERALFHEAIEAFYKMADRYDLEPVFYGVSGTWLELYHDLGFRLFKLGERALVPTAGFTLAGKRRESLRHSVKQAERAGAGFEVLEHPLNETVLRELQHVSDAWLKSKRTAEKGFSLGRFERDYLQRSPLAVVRQQGQVVAFASLMPAYGSRRQLAVDLMRSLPTAPKGSMDLMFVRLIEYAGEQGYEYFDMGVAPLSNVGRSPYARIPEKAARLAFEHGNRFYSYKGLRSYKSKFDPQWQGVYLAYRPRSPLPALLLDLAALIAGGYRRLLSPAQGCTSG